MGWQIGKKRAVLATLQMVWKLVISTNDEDIKSLCVCVGLAIVTALESVGKATLCLHQLSYT